MYTYSGQILVKKHHDVLWKWIHHTLIIWCIYDYKICIINKYYDNYSIIFLKMYIIMTKNQTSLIVKSEFRVGRVSSFFLSFVCQVKI